VTAAVTSLKQYSWAFDTSGMNGGADATFYHVTPDADYYWLGDYLDPAKSWKTGPIGAATLTAKEVGVPIGPPLLIQPTSCTLIWRDNGGHGQHDGSIWQVNPPNGYQALGVILQAGYNAPDLTMYRCVHTSQVGTTTTGPRWTDIYSGAKMDISVFSILNFATTPAPTGLLVGQANYNSYDGTAYMIKGVTE
ncbi:MAG: DUF946 domain-containing protein, partial [Oxalobacteraceae bacterium]